MIYLYIMVDPDKEHKCKVGITKNPQQRIKPYRTSNPDCFFKVVYTIPHKRHEKEILNLLKMACTVKSEYIHGSPNIVQNIIEGYFDDHDIDY